MKHLTILFLAFLFIAASCTHWTKKSKDGETKTDAMNTGFTLTPLEFLEDAAEKGDAEAQAELGKRCYDGDGVYQDYSEAISWYKCSIAKGNARAEYLMGLCYLEGHGVEQSATEAVRWFYRSAEKGDTSAQYRLAECYLMGNGVRQSEVEAVKWYQKAMKLGSKQAQEPLDSLSKDKPHTSNK